MNDSNDMWYKGGDAMEELELFYQHKVLILAMKQYSIEYGLGLVVKYIANSRATTK